MKNMLFMKNGNSLLPNYHLGYNLFLKVSNNKSSCQVNCGAMVGTIIFCYFSTIFLKFLLYLEILIIFYIKSIDKIHNSIYNVNVAT